MDYLDPVYVRCQVYAPSRRFPDRRTIIFYSRDGEKVEVMTTADRVRTTSIRVAFLNQSKDGSIIRVGLEGIISSLYGQSTVEVAKDQLVRRPARRA